MGLFRRSRDDGFYTGDAPASVPGADGAGPSAYVRPEPGTAGGRPSMTFPGIAPIPGARPAPGGSDLGGPAFGTVGDTSYLGVTQPTTTQSPQPFSPQQVPGPLPAVTITTNTTPSGLDRFRGLGKLDGPELVDRLRGGRSGVPGTARIVKVLVTLMVAAIAIPAAIGAFNGIGKARIIMADPDLYTSPLPEVGAGLPVFFGGDVVPVSFGGAAFDVTVFGAQLQPTDAWDHASERDAPVLVVDAEIARTDGGADPVDVLGWNWYVEADPGAGVGRTTGDIISHYEPSLDDARPAGRQSLRGFVTFGIGETGVYGGSVTVVLTSGPAGRPVAKWEVAPTLPVAIDGVLGRPVQAEISRPGFTVTLANAFVAGSGDPRAARAESGQYVVFDVMATPNPGTDGHLGLLDRDDFVFVPDGGGEPLVPTFGAVPDAMSFFSIDAAKPETGLIAFDTAATAGVVEWRNGAGTVIATWRVDL